MATILKNSIKPSGSTLKGLVATNASGTKQNVKFVRQVNSSGVATTVYDTLKEYTFGGITISSFKYGDIPAGGGTVTPSELTYSQSKTEVGHSGVTYGTSTLSSGATISYSGTGVNTSTGAVSASSLGTEATERTKITTVTVTVTMNGKSATKTFDVYQEANTYSDAWNAPVVSAFSYAKNTIGYEGETLKVSKKSATQTGTRTFASGDTSALSNTSFTWTYSGSATGYTLNKSTGALTGASNVSASTRSITVTAKATANGKSGTKTYKVTQEAHPSNGYEYVDLGLPSGLKWAACNVGATLPEGYGDHFAWGETEAKTYYDWSTYKYCNGTASTLTKYNDTSSSGTVDNKSVLEMEDDAAHVNMGGEWRMPTHAEHDELINSDYTTTEWTTINGYGRKITSKINGNSIFLPAGGIRYDNNISDKLSRGYYWSSELCYHPSVAYNLDSTYASISTGAIARYWGHTVRGVINV